MTGGVMRDDLQSHTDAAHFSVPERWITGARHAPISLVLSIKNYSSQ